MVLAAEQSANVLYLNAFRFFSIHASLFIMQHSIVLSINSMVWLCSFHTINSNQHLDTYSITSHHIGVYSVFAIGQRSNYSHMNHINKINANDNDNIVFQAAIIACAWLDFSFIRLEGVWNSAFFSPVLIDLRTRLLLNTKHLFNIQITVNSSQKQIPAMLELAQIFRNMIRFKGIIFSLHFL